MAEVTREDIGKVHSRLDTLVEEQTKSRIAIGKIETHLKMMPAPQSRPCPQHLELKADFDSHIEIHKESRRLWQTPVVGMLIHLVELGTVALVTW
ncbi:MAG TPA: hypothetical protein VMW24_27175, partial [Sedimentisphaerales bacterium]|nr:hypothetical protein [Sedimentisphaerales bacterium]